ncbi:MAG: helix-turn-helix domain-containing protein [Methylococcales bacterium]|nr:helix-turn-helix domain-containing protein [Methylococcales bacterium]
MSHRGLSLDIRRQALQLYLAGLGFRPIGRLLKCSHVTVAQWIHEHGETIKSMRASEINVVKTKALQAYIETKQHAESVVTTLVIDIQSKSTSLCIPITPKQES